MPEVTYTHVLDDRGRCTCGWYVPLSDPDFATRASQHYIATTAQAVRDQTGWRGWWNRVRGRK